MEGLYAASLNGFSGSVRATNWWLLVACCDFGGPLRRGLGCSMGAGGGSSVPDEGLAEHLKDGWSATAASERFSRASGHGDHPGVARSSRNRGRKCKARPLAKPLGFDRLGYLQYDLYPGRLFLPTMPTHGQLEVMPRDGTLEVKSGGEVVADLSYWNAGWGPVRPVQFDGNCGTALISRGTAYRAAPGSTASDVRSFYFWRVRTLHKIAASAALTRH